MKSCCYRYVHYLNLERCSVVIIELQYQLLLLTFLIQISRTETHISTEKYMLDFFER